MAKGGGQILPTHATQWPYGAPDLSNTTTPLGNYQDYKSVAKLLAEENKIMMMNRSDMDEVTLEWHDIARKEILHRRKQAFRDAGGDGGGAGGGGGATTV